MKIKKVLLGAFLTVACAVSAQEKGDFSVFAGPSYDEAVGVTMGGSYAISNKLAIVPSFSYHFIAKPQGFDTASLKALNLDIKYNFVNSGKFKVFGLLGFVRRTRKWYIDLPLLSDDEKTILTRKNGVSLGAGASYDLGNNLSLIAQTKYLFLKDVDGTGLAPFIGLQYTF